MAKTARSGNTARSPICAATSTASTRRCIALLMERGEIIDRLIAVKRTQEIRLGVPAGARSRDDAPAGRAPHGILPLDTVESIWRVIIATFTYVQAPFSVHADLSAGDAAMRDSRALPFRLHGAVRCRIWARPSVVEAVPESKGDLGLVPAFAVAGAGAWWTALEFDTAPKIIARCRSSSAPTIRRRCRFSSSRARPPTPW